MVAVAILLAIMAMVGAIFHTASKSSSKAQAMAAVYRQAGASLSQIKRDLESCHPGDDNNAHAILAIAGVEVAAFASPKDQQGPIIDAAHNNGLSPKDPNQAAATDPDRFSDIHRADVLMFTTDRDLQPYVFTQDGARLVNGGLDIPLDPTAMVTYGHADIMQLDEISGKTGQYQPSLVIRTKRIESSDLPVLNDGGNPNPIGVWAQSDIPASTWHLARRILRFPQQTRTGNCPEGMYPTLTSLSIPLPLNGLDLLDGNADVFQYQYSNPAQLFDPSGTANPSILGQVGQGLHVTPALDAASSTNPAHYGNHIFRYSPDGVNTYWYRWETDKSNTVTWYLFTQDHWWVHNGAQWQRTEIIAGTPQTIALVPAVAAPDPSTGKPFVPDLFWLTYPNRIQHPDPSASNPLNRRTLLDPAAPAGAAKHMGAYFMPNCSDFMVEYTYDDPAEVQLVNDGSGNWRAETQAPIRWQRVPNGQQMVWSRLSVSPKNYSDPNDPRNRTDPIRWPRALRITIRAWGPGTTLEEPIEQVIVHTFQ